MIEIFYNYIYILIELLRDNIRVILGVLLGGLFFGVIIIIGIVYVLYRRFCYSIIIWYKFIFVIKYLVFLF